MNEWHNVFGTILTLPLLALAAAGSSSSGFESQAPATRRTVEIRSYNLKPGARPAFHRLAAEVAVPMLRRWKIDVVAYGPSPQDETSYYLIRAYASPVDRERSEEVFYGSDEWRNGPRERVLALIETYTTIILDLAATTVEGLRRE